MTQREKVERKAFSTVEFECLPKQTDGSKYENFRHICIIS